MDNRGSSWHVLGQNFPACVPEKLYAWIRLETSMTERLQECFGPEIQVQVVRARAGLLYFDEQGFFTPQQAQGYVREVVLYAANQHLLAARTVFTMHTAYTKETIVRLGDQPLGALLFAQGRPQYVVREYAQITPSMPVFGLVQQALGDFAPPCWARRSLFVLNQTSLLVTEVFLPALLQA